MVEWRVFAVIPAVGGLLHLLLPLLPLPEGLLRLLSTLLRLRVVSLPLPEDLLRLRGGSLPMPRGLLHLPKTPLPLRMTLLRLLSIRLLALPDSWRGVRISSKEEMNADSTLTPGEVGCDDIGGWGVCLQFEIVAIDPASLQGSFEKV
jgi:hypothetical protein